MLKLFLWLKNLRRKKIVLLSIVAVALSCALLIVVASIFSGFIKAVETSASDVVGDIIIKPPTRFAGSQKFMDELQKLRGVKAVTAVLQSQGLLRLDSGDVRAVIVLGVDPVSRAAVMDFKSSLVVQKNAPYSPSFAVPNEPNEAGGFLGIGVIAEPDEKTDLYDFEQVKRVIGKEVVLTTGTIADPVAGGTEKFRPRRWQFKVTDVVFSGIYEIDTKYVYVPLDTLQELLYPQQGKPVDMVQIKLDSGISPQIVIGAIRLAFDNFARTQLGWGDYLISETEIETAQQMQARYIAELHKQMAMLMLIFGVVSLGAILLIFCIFYMIVVTKQKDIAILKSCGTSNASIAMIFVSYGLFVGVVGSLCGMVIGYIFVRNINAIEQWVNVMFGLKIWKSSVYVFSKIPSEFDVYSAMWIVAAAIVAAAVGALIPAVAAARLRPVRILRYE
ncbi:MAG: FtsX-like permease family protein [Sedimentisphaerales bacterium]|nr:FtsX-like permease family protein [Sedimentisphaerales bacterium]